MRCDICGIEIETIEEAIENGWIPYFYEGENEHGPVCSSCAQQLICMGEDGEAELKQEYRGKIIYQGGDYAYEEPKQGWVIGIAVTDKEGIGKC